VAPILASVLAATLTLTPAAAQPDVDENIARYHQLAADLSVTVAQTEIMHRQVGSLQQQIAQRRAVVGRVAAATYRSHRVDPLYVLSDAATTDEAMRRLVLLTGFTMRQKQEIRALQLESARYDAARRTLDSLVTQQRRQQHELLILRHRLHGRRS
jgi:peptidoglycan DL-endopeptidase CwlO